MVWNLSQCDADFGRRVAEGIGVPAMQEPVAGGARR
jgi:hypothetical protein